MVMNADAVEACLLAAGDEGGEVRQGAPNGDSDIHADPLHLREAPSFSRPTIRGLHGNENRAKRFMLLLLVKLERSDSRVGIATVGIFSSKKHESAHALGNI